MTPARTRLTIQTGRICQLLVSLGLPKVEVYRRDGLPQGSFWERNESRLLEWLDRAHKAYRKRIVSLHPDRNGSVEAATRLNLAWGKTRRLFKKHGVTL